MKKKICILGIFFLLVLSGILMPINFVEASNTNMKRTDSLSNNNALSVDLWVDGEECIDKSINTKVGNILDFTIRVEIGLANGFENIYIAFIPQSLTDDEINVVYEYVENSASNDYLIDCDFEYPVWSIPSIDFNVDLECSIKVIDEGVDETILVVLPENAETQEEIFCYQFEINTVKDSSNKMFAKLPAISLFFDKIMTKINKFRDKTTIVDISNGKIKGQTQSNYKKAKCFLIAFTEEPFTINLDAKCRSGIIKDLIYVQPEYKDLVSPGTYIRTGQGIFPNHWGPAAIVIYNFIFGNAYIWED